MLDEAYREAMGHMGPSGEELTRLRARLEETMRKGPRHVLRTALVAIAACVALLTSALALSPALREALVNSLGSFWVYSSEVDGVSVTDNGIQIKVVSALADQNRGVVYFEVTDLKGNRLGEDAAFNDFWNTPTAYDAEKHTALYSRGLDLQDRNEDGTATLSIDCFLPGLERFESVKLPWDLVTETRLETMTVEPEGGIWDDKLVLKPNQTPAELSTDLVSLSSMGFDSNGVFHVQIAVADGVSITDNSRTTISPQTVKADWEQGGGWNSVIFGGGKYLDFVFENYTIDRLGHFRVDDLGGTVCTRPVIEGDWTLTFPLEILAERVVTSEVNLSHTRLAAFYLSAMTLRLDTVFDAPDKPSYLGSYPVSIFLKDGTVLPLEYTDHDALWRDENGEVINGGGLMSGEHVYYLGGEHCGERYLWTLPQSVEPENVTAISVGKLMIPFEENTAGEAYWLDEAP